MEEQHIPFALIDGEAFNEIPKDLYIPPDALKILVEAFQGPLDLLLYLIKKQNIDILNINVAEITDQYMAYVELMESSQFELAAEYLVMAAMLAEIKSRMLLPRQEDLEAEEDDPRMELIRRLQEYERFKKAAAQLDELPRMNRDFHRAIATPPKMERVTIDPDVELKDVLVSLAQVLRRADMFGSHQIHRETLSTREKMSELLVRINDKKFVPLSSLLIREEGRLGVVVTFLAIMELLKGSMIEIVQSEPFAPIHVKARTLGEQPVITSDFDDDLDGKQEGDRDRDQEEERDARY
ncbi:MAG: ScpA family protein [Gammaproteobacteria bacterium]|nr:ScpA family protein [Gammaproteobacteria bacterium]MDG1515420.1 ScpA family protein [Gammaproteobacteria bacterium]